MLQKSNARCGFATRRSTPVGSATTVEHLHFGEAPLFLSLSATK
jgi:hypothetical protein